MGIIKKKAVKLSEKEYLKAGIYKGYDIRWLADNPDHPDHHLAAEGEKKRKALK